MAVFAKRPREHERAGEVARRARATPYQRPSDYRALSALEQPVERAEQSALKKLGTISRTVLNVFGSIWQDISQEPHHAKNSSSPPLSEEPAHNASLSDTNIPDIPKPSETLRDSNEIKTSTPEHEHVQTGENFSTNEKLSWKDEAPMQFDLSTLATGPNMLMNANVLISSYRDALLANQGHIPSIPKREATIDDDESARPHKFARTSNLSASTQSTAVAHSTRRRSRATRLRTNRNMRHQSLFSRGFTVPHAESTIPEHYGRIELVTKPMVDLEASENKSRPGFISANFDIDDKDDDEGNVQVHGPNTNATSSISASSRRRPADLDTHASQTATLEPETLDADTATAKASTFGSSQSPQSLPKLSFDRAEDNALTDGEKIQFDTEVSRGGLSANVASSAPTQTSNTAEPKLGFSKSASSSLLFGKEPDRPDVVSGKESHTGNPPSALSQSDNATSKSSLFQPVGNSSSPKTASNPLPGEPSTSSKFTFTKPNLSQPAFSTRKPLAIEDGPANGSKEGSDESPQSTTAPFKFGSNHDTSNSDGQKSHISQGAFTFAATVDKDKAGSSSDGNTNTSQPAFSFGAKHGSSSDSGPVFSFGASGDKENSAAAPSILSSKDNNESATPTFNFGSKTEGGTPVNSQPSSASRPSSAPAFSFGSTANESLSKPSSESDATKSTTGGFTFGGNNATKKGEVGSAFSFGSSENKSSSGAFNFAASANNNTGTQSFTFGSTSANIGGENGASSSSRSDTPFASGGKEPTKSAFTFGMNNGTSQALGNGSVREDSAGAAPVAFGTNGQNSEALVFGTKRANPFGASNGENKPSANAFSFGDPSKFGAQQSGSGSQDSQATQDTKRPFTFGTSSSGSGSTPFAFGAASTGSDTQNSQAFTFGQQPATTAPFGQNAATAAGGFQFGATSSTLQPSAFNFGGSQSSGMVFSGSSSNTPQGATFGANSASNPLASGLTQGQGQTYSPATGRKIAPVRRRLTRR